MLRIVKENFSTVREYWYYNKKEPKLIFVLYTTDSYKTLRDYNCVDDLKDKLKYIKKDVYKLIHNTNFEKDIDNAVKVYDYDVNSLKWLESVFDKINVILNKL